MQDTSHGKGRERDAERRRQGQRLAGLVQERWRARGGVSGLSRELGVSRATIYSWFKGATSPDTATLTRLARLLVVSPSELLMALGGSDQSELLDARIREVTAQTLHQVISDGTDEETRMLARAPDSWRQAPSGPAAMEQRLEVRAGRPSLARRISAPAATVLDLMGPQEVAWCDADDPVGPVAQRMYRANYSQLPVRDRDRWVGLLTTDTIARWTAARSGRGRDYDEATPVREVLPYAEDPDSFRIAGHESTAAEVLRMFDDRAASGRLLSAVLVTPKGQPRGKLLRIVTSSDLPQFRSASHR